MTLFARPKMNRRKQSSTSLPSGVVHVNFCGPDMKKLSENFPAVKFYKVDIDEVGAGPTISKLKVFSVPTLHFFKNGKKAAEVVGADVMRIKDISSELYRDNSTM